MSDPETIGLRLRAAREAKELTLAEAERATRIRLKFLDALERGDYSGMTAVQVQGFMRNYTRFLGLDYDLLLTEFDSTTKSRGRRRAKESPIPQAAPPPKSSARRPSVGRFFNRLIALVLAAALLGVLVMAADHDHPPADGGRRRKKRIGADHTNASTDTRRNATRSSRRATAIRDGDARPQPNPGIVANSGFGSRTNGIYAAHPDRGRHCIGGSGRAPRLAARDCR